MRLDDDEGLVRAGRTSQSGWTVGASMSANRIEGSKKTDADLHHLSSLSNLKELWVSKSHVIKGGFEQLHKKLPS